MVLIYLERNSKRIRKANIVTIKIHLPPIPWFLDLLSQNHTGEMQRSQVQFLPSSGCSVTSVAH